ncbi:uncharacterized protein PV06_08875 [Exophiala oligosperma]|uniref:ABM domain-containing protein n=2 Tax=Chaetothyriales TaxID=34395 RepID=A0A0D2D7G0_9EURO|nr:uncharacterized protein PV06_08875 [Exophiala oligosperma]KAJ9629195.1 hypothetical protein H2204_008984 [Knufia peltigerae]KIW39063.1 hypothetical protein PV06_08875 [Exophiala oligosperma]
MAIIELAHISLKDGLTATDPTLKKNLKEVKRVIEEYSRLVTLFYTQVDDPTSMFVIGAWETKDAHQHGFNGSPQQGQILGLVKDQMDIDWMHYMDIEQSRIPLDAPVLMLNKAVFKRGVHHLAIDNEFAQRTSTMGGARHGAVSTWNIPKDDKEHAVRVHFSGWDTADEAVESVAGVIATGKTFVPHILEARLFITERTVLD